MTGGQPVGDSFLNVGFLSTYVQGHYESEINLLGFIRDGIGPLRVFNADRCVVTRISKDILITAAHCLKEKDGTNVDGVQVVLENRAYTIEKFEIHPRFRIDPVLNFESAMPQYDVAVLYSKKMGEDDLEIPNVHLPNTEITRDPVLTSIGRQHRESVSNGHVVGVIVTATLMKAEFEIQDIFEDVSWKKLNLFDKYTMVSSRSTIRQGDSGGPSFRIEGDKLYLVGVHSMVVSCRDCKPNWVNADTSIYKYRDWIKQTIEVFVSTKATTNLQTESPF
jgi:hypothetical protein